MTQEFGVRARELGKDLSSQPLQLEVQGKVGLPPEQLFDFFVDIDGMAKWLPMARRTWSDDANAEAPGEVGSVRMIDAGMGPYTEERVIHFERPGAYAYKASDKSLRGMFTDHTSVVTIESHPSGGSVLTWIAHAKPTNPLMRFIGRKVFAMVLGGGLRNLQKRFPAK